MNRRKPNDRRQRVDWIKRKKGKNYVRGFEYMTDREIKRLFDSLYPIYRDAPDIDDSARLVADLEAFAKEQSME